ncbi:FixH [Phycisphaerae bacterium RAS1]|nr:FixH [Phycisphaerae bacterium RAS1]
MAAFVDPQTPTLAPPPARPAVWFWPALVFALLGMQVVICGAIIYASNTDPTFAVEPDYYQKSLNWDAAQAQQRAQNALGWTLSLDVSSTATPLGQRQLRCRLADRDGQPLEGAAVSAEAFHHARGNERTRIDFTAAAPGSYEAAALLRKPGVWEFRFDVRRGEQSFVITQTIDVRQAIGGPR